MSTNMTMKAIKDGKMSNQLIVHHIKPNDVLFGRGSPIVNNKGNRRFHKVVSYHKAQYMKSDHHEIKNRIANEVIETIIIKNGGRFLRRVQDHDEKTKLNRNSLMSDEGVWMIVDEYATMQKVKQALREQGGSKKLAALSTKTANNGTEHVPTVKKNCQKPVGIITPKDDQSNEITIVDNSTVMIGKKVNECDEEQRHGKELLSTTTTNNSRNTNEDFLVTSTRQQLEKQTLISELLKRSRKSEIENNEISANPYHAAAVFTNTLSIPTPSSSYIGIPQQQAIVASSQNFVDTSSLLLQNPHQLLRYQDNTIPDIIQNTSLDMNVVDYHHLNLIDTFRLQQRQVNNNAMSLYNNQIAALLQSTHSSSPSLLRIPQQHQKTDNIGIANHNGFQGLMNHNMSHNIDIELLLLQKMHEISNTILLTTNSFMTKRRKTDDF